MASVSYKLFTKKNPANIYCRFLNGRTTDITTTLNIHVDPKNWDAKNQKIKNVIEVRNRDLINRKLQQLKIDIVDAYNLAFFQGEVIDKDWLNEVIANFMKRPKHEKEKENNHTLYYVEFAEWWIKNKSNTWLTASDSYMNERTKNQYLAFVELVKSFQAKSKIKLSSSGNGTITKFVFWLNENSYAEKTIKRHINRFKFFYLRARAEGFKVDPTFEQRVFVPKSEDILEPILNAQEIEKIYNTQFDSEVLDNARDNLIIACWTGLRVSDYLKKLDISNFIDDFIEIKTTKTRTRITIPVHPMVKRILIKRNGNLPKKVNEADFNKNIKTVCKKAGIVMEMKGSIYNKNTKRKEVDIYKKHELVTSHIGRRSFATNHFGKLPNSVIMRVCGWSKEEMMLKYIKKSNREDAVALQQYWEETYKT